MDETPNAQSAVTIDCDYIHPGRMAAYLLVEGKQAVFVDNNTPHAVPLLLGVLAQRGLVPENVVYAVVTHVHLDHAAGTAALLSQCPRAQVLVHPRAVRHLIDPGRVVAGAKQVYGEAVFAKLYGEIAPVDAARIRTVEDGEAVCLGERPLVFLHTRGHANHHICMYDSRSHGVFTGDTFGVSPPSRGSRRSDVVLFSCPPTDFDPQEARNSIGRIAATGAERAYLSHFGEVAPVDRAAQQLLRSVDSLEVILNEAVAAAPHNDPLNGFCEPRLRAAIERESAQRHAPLTQEDWDWLAPDIRINAQGLAHLAAKRMAGTPTR